MNTKRRQLVATAIFFVLFAAVQSLCAITVSGIRNGIPDCAEVYNQEGLGITMGQAFEANGARLSVCAISVEALELIGAEGHRDIPAYIARATPASHDALPYTYTVGGWIQNWGGERAEERTAVIPDTMSLALFGTDRPEGVFLRIGAEDYMVCGVYRSDRGFLSGISGDGMARVFLSVTAENENLPAAAVYLRGGDTGNAQILYRRLSEAARANVRGIVTDFSQRAELAGSIRYLSWLICGLCLAALIFLRAGGALYASYASRGKPAGVRVRKAVLGVAMIAAPLIGLHLALRGFEIPSAYLPDDNILRLSFYRDTIISFFQSMNAKGPVAYWDRYYAARMITLSLLCVLSVVFFAVGAVKLRGIFRKDDEGV